MTIGAPQMSGAAATVGMPPTSAGAPTPPVAAASAGPTQAAPLAQPLVQPAAPAGADATEPSRPSLAATPAVTSGPATRVTSTGIAASRPASGLAAAPVAPVSAGRATPGPSSAATTRASGPIVSARPLRPGIQRAPLTIPARLSEEAVTGTPVAPAAAPAGPAGSPVKVHRGSAANQLSTALEARSFTHGGEIFMPDSHGPLTTGRGRALLAHELTHVAQQRRFGSSLPAEHTSQGRTLEAEAAAAERSPDMPLAGSLGSAAISSAGTASIAVDPHVAGRPQRAPLDDDALVPRPIVSGPGSGRRGPGGAEPTNPTDPGRMRKTDQELEDLAQQLYSRIGRRLRRELLVDRERAGRAVEVLG